MVGTGAPRGPSTQPDTLQFAKLLESTNALSGAHGVTRSTPLSNAVFTISDISLYRVETELYSFNHEQRNRPILGGN